MKHPVQISSDECKTWRDSEVDITHIQIKVPVYFGDEDIPNDFPLRNGPIWNALVEIHGGKIMEWPSDPRFAKCQLHMKVCDGGQYTLFYSDYWDGEYNMWPLVEKKGYVPHGVVPGSYGDYIELEIENGVITNWPKNPDVSAFFGKNEE